ncbi:AIG1 family-domain-containing protein [Endogone sp. FLAS-F59071]|nr:AIG1 family-domain-containing protein [Endogone sp. FLAS-F59071]|eukprot:RUS15626.1 AIG1 family-domain-containing protein [Endogone sp. FLAS-F59071]
MLDLQNIQNKTPAVLLIGKTGSGKSTLGNSLCGEEVFETSDSQESCTSVCKTVPLDIGGKIYNLIDTPGLLDTNKMSLSILLEIQSVIYGCRDGIQAIIFVMTAERFTNEQDRVLTLIQEFLGKESNAHIIVAFTRCSKRQTETNTLDFSKIQSFISAVENRWVIVPNPDIFDTDTIKEHINKLKFMIAEMESPYTINLFKLARKAYNLHETAKRGCIEEISKTSNPTEAELKQATKELQVEKEQANKEHAEVMAEIEEKLHALQAKSSSETNSSGGGGGGDGGSGSGSGGGGGGGECFTIDTTVITSSAKVVPLSQLEIGDRILCRGSGGKLEYSEVYTFIHYNTESLTEFRTIFFTKPNGTKGRVSLTPQHHIFVNRTIDFAGHVCPKSSKLLVLQDNSLVLASIDKIITETKKGFVCVLTRSGTLIADEALCSCFCDILPSPTMQVLAQMAFAPLRLYTHFFRSAYRLPEIHPYAQILVNIMLAFEDISVILMHPTKDKNATFLTAICFVALMACICMNMSVFPPCPSVIEMQVHV